MSYIGKTPTIGNFIKLDAITTSATNSYTLQHNSVNFSPESANHMLVSLNGVIQAPNTSFSVSGSTITFLPSSGTLSSSDSIDFIMVYGNVLDVGVASTVTDASITKAKMNLISDSSSAGLTIKGDGGSENGTIQLNCSQNSHGVKISSPAHSAGQSYELILPTGNVTADKVLKVASVSGSGATGIGQLSFGDASSDYVLLSSTDASSSSGVSLDLFSSTYKNYKVLISNLVCSNNDWLYVRFRRSSSDVSSANYYNANFQVYKTSSAQGDFNNSNWGDTAIRILVTSGDSSRPASSELTIFDPYGTSYTNMTSYSTYWENTSSYRTSIQGANLIDATTSVTGISIYPTSGNITGNIKLYGIK